MLNATGSLPRPVWYTEIWEVGRSVTPWPTRATASSTPTRWGPTCAGADYYRTRKGYGGAAKGDIIIFEVIESRVMPRCVGKIERGPLHYTHLWKVAQGMTTRPSSSAPSRPARRRGAARRGARRRDLQQDRRGLRAMTEVWCHTCWGNPVQQRLFASPQSYPEALPHLARLDVEV
jgi:hypothetical protein